MIIIIGILAAIALPSFLNQANRARESEAKTYVGTINRAQQAYYLEAQEFATNDQLLSGALGLGISLETDNYDYFIAGGGPSETVVTNQARPAAGSDAAVRAFVGVTAVYSQLVTGEATTGAVLCQGNVPPLAGGPVGTEVGSGGGEVGPPNCPADAGYDQVS